MRARLTALAVSFGVAFGLPGCVRQARADERVSGGGRAGQGELLGEGLASFYGPGLAGNLTANGERFDSSKLTAAHRTLHFGTCLRVRNLANGAEVEVRVNDRGPYSGHRVLDVTEAAARVLGMEKRGVTRVRFWRCAGSGQ